MKPEDFDIGINEVEEICGRKYENQHMVKKLKQVARYWSLPDWRRVVDRLIETGLSRQPIIKDFVKAYSEVRDTRGQNDKDKVEDFCPMCDGEGLIISIERSCHAFPEKDYTGAVLCSCKNADNWDTVIPTRNKILDSRLCTIKEAVQQSYNPSMVFTPSEGEKVAYTDTGGLSEYDDSEFEGGK